MRLVIFDVDGTLTDTMAVDTQCFLRTFAKVCGFADINSDWSCYKSATDAGIFQEIFKSRMGRAPSAAETKHFRDHLVALFRSAAQEKAFAAVPGASDLLVRLKQSDEYRVAVATGCWADSARVKMASAGMCYNDYPSASADDAPEREAIVQLAMNRAEPFSRAIYVGDGVWDIRACRKVGIPFLGIAAGMQKEKLVAAGAVRVLPDFSDQDRFFASIDQILAI
jgi:phosphoglycolate phosphatase-like HAD superfamily hydrolase